MPSGVYERSPELREAIRAARLGSKASPETRAKMSAAMKGRKLSPEHREKIRQALTGRKRPPETVAKMSAAMKGRKASPEARAKMSAALAGRFRGEEHHGWKGDEAGWWGIHAWVRRNFPKSGVCEECGVVATKRAHHYASIGHTYTRNREDWRELCPRCHKAFDKAQPRATAKSPPRPRRRPNKATTG